VVAAVVVGNARIYRLRGLPLRWLWHGLATDGLRIPGLDTRYLAVSNACTAECPANLTEGWDRELVRIWVLGLVGWRIIRDGTS
jgi:hypothetical protein